MFGFFSIGYSLSLALAAALPETLGWATGLFLLALALRNFARGPRWREWLSDAAPGLAGLAATLPWRDPANWEGRCLAGILVYGLLADRCQRQLVLEQDRDNFAIWAQARDWTLLYRLFILFLAPVLACLHVASLAHGAPIYAVFFAVPLLAGVQRAAFSELLRCKLLDQETVLRKDSESRLALLHTQERLQETTRHLRFQEWTQTALLELTGALASSRDMRATAQAALQALSHRVRYRQLAVFVAEKGVLQPLYWLGTPEAPQLPPSYRHQLVIDDLSWWPLEEEGVLVVDNREGPTLNSEEVYLIGMVAGQTALGLQSARRFRQQQDAQAGVLLASKMAAVGQLAAGVAHELNTPLGAVLLQLELAQISPEKSEKALGVAQKAIEHAQTIIGRLLYYSREGASQKARLDLNQIVLDTLTLLQSQLKIDRVDVKTQLCERALVSVNANEMQQIFTNLIINAKDACLESTSRGRTVLVRSQADAEWVLIEILDQGAGIPPEIRERIFEPFFTSKAVGKGVGLGLSVSLELAEQHGGRLTAGPAPEPYSTSFRLQLPAVS